VIDHKEYFYFTSQTTCGKVKLEQCLKKAKIVSPTTAFAVDISKETAKI